MEEQQEQSNMKKQILTSAKRREVRVRRKILNNIKHPRLSIYRSAKHFYAQIIDDKTKKTLVSVTEKELEKGLKATKTEKAKLLGVLVATKAKKAKITTVIFDRGQFKYHGRVKSFADSAREGGLVF